MCRIAAYIGPPTPLSSLLYEPGHSLEEQSYRPCEMLSGTVNVDGTGVAWWSNGDPAPLRYATVMPPWSDPNLPTLSRRLRGSPILATVRSATPGVPGGIGAVLPFVEEGIAGSHNGFLNGFADGVAVRCLEALPPKWRSRVETMTDARLLFLMAVAALEERPELGLAGACEHAVASAAAICRDLGHDASLNLVIADRSSICGVRFALGRDSNTLYADDGVDGGGRRLASEPLDDADWRPVPDRHLVLLEEGRIELRPAEALAGLE